MRQLSFYDGIIFIIAILLGLFIANLILILFKTQIRISILGSFIITLALLFVQIFL